MSSCQIHGCLYRMVPFDFVHDALVPYFILQWLLLISFLLMTFFSPSLFIWISMLKIAGCTFGGMVMHRVVADAHSGRNTLLKIILLNFAFLNFVHFWEYSSKYTKKLHFWMDGDASGGNWCTFGHIYVYIHKYTFEKCMLSDILLETMYPIPLKIISWKIHFGLNGDSWSGSRCRWISSRAQLYASRMLSFHTCALSGCPWEEIYDCRGYNWSTVIQRWVASFW